MVGLNSFAHVFRHLTLKESKRSWIWSGKRGGFVSVPFDCRRFQCEMASSLDKRNERSFIMIKPDGVQRGLVGEIIKRFEQKGFHLVGLKMVTAGKYLLEEHYKDLAEKPFFAGLVDYMGTGPVVAMVWEGLGVVKTGRKMLGETNPANSLPGTIRGDFSVEVGRNIIHGSDSVESAEREIQLWFQEQELNSWKATEMQWIYEMK